MSGTLFVVATPIGNLGDLPPRAADTLGGVAVVAAEDTRHTRKLLSHLGLHPALVSIHAHTPPARIARLVERLAGGDDVALVTDAGTPAVSDPGVALVRAARAAGVRVVPIPGPSAVAVALSAAGQPADQYLFLGFPPRKGPERRRWLAEAVASAWTVVAFEAANRVVELLGDLAAAGSGAREAMVGRELTKLHEELRHGTVTDLAAYYAEHPPRGEVTLVVAGQQGSGADGQEPPMKDIVARLLAAGLSKRDAASALHATLGIARNEAYRMVNEA